jgi:hypothetical protein
LKDTFIIIVVLILIGCSRQEIYVPDFSNTIDYHCREIKYMGTSKIKDNVVSYKYFNEKKQLIEQVGHEYRIKYKYNKQGELIEKFSCRMYNCEIGWREIMFYDNKRNYIGSFFTLDTLILFDTIKVVQIKYYDEHNNLIKELSDKGSDVNGNKYECWKNYQIENGKIIKEIETNNGNTTWIGSYKYDLKNNLVTINRIQEELYENELMEYNSKNQLTKKTIESNRYPLTENTFYSVCNNTTIYKYDNLDRLIEEITYNHKGEIYRTFLYDYDCKE